VPGNAGATVNPSLFCDQRVERALAVARRLQASDPSRAPLAWARVDRLVTDLAPWAPTFSPRALYFVSKRIRNYQFHRNGPADRSALGALGEFGGTLLITAAAPAAADGEHEQSKGEDCHG
jgi:hypothetical protein